jgi:hypothetical protein
MKLGALKAAIRDTPKIKGKLFFGDFVMEKAALIATLDAYYAGGRSQETGLTVTETGHLEFEDRAVAYGASV